MKKNLLLFLCLISLGTVKSQLSGTALLQGQTNHSGIRIKFIAQSGTAVTDSSYTTASGNYSINIAPGVYSIAFAKTGFIETYYNNGASIVLTNTTVLTGISLTSGNPIYLSGVVSGTWTSNNVYVVLGDLTIPANTTLFIMAGTRVQFNGNYSIGGSGVIKASGTNANPILFTSGKQSAARNDWKQIGLNSTASHFDNCIFEYFTFGLNFQNGGASVGANVTNCIFRHGGGAAIVMSGSILIENNEVYDLYDNSGGGVIAVSLEGGTISCNFVHDISGGQYCYAISNSSGLVKDNRIMNVNVGIRTAGTGGRYINNCISNCGTAIKIDDNWNSSNPLVANNTLFSNYIGIKIQYGLDVNKPTNPIIVNNLITDNQTGIERGGTPNGTLSIQHNLLWNQSVSDYTSIQLVGLGQIVSTNSSGYPIDSYYNMHQDPIYNGIAPTLSANSPCYGAGNTAYSGQIGFNSQQGCVSAVVSIDEKKENNRLKIFPNPTSGILTLSTESKEEVLISIFAMDGRMVHTLSTRSGEQFDLSHLANGTYMLSLNKGEVVTTTLLLIYK